MGDPKAARSAIGAATPPNPWRRGANVLSRALPAVFGRHFCAVVMTGMGDDGLDACVEVHRAGGYIIAQEASTCTVYGMPRAIVENGIASQIVGLTQLADAIRESVR
ncbi:MAG TPA: chemotaxis protein CheB, partial [Planctomycetota bacterium]|nr:chemotaxis protein CheB [Planctomycetota bacterium]